MRIIFFIFLIFFPLLTGAVEEQCPSEAINEPTPVNISELKSKILALSDSNQKKIFTLNPAFEKSIEDVFDLTKVKTKMEQFYTMLWILGQELVSQKTKSISVNKKSVQDVLIASKVFTDDAIPNQIETIEFDISNANKPKYSVTFIKSNIDVLLNQGKGFYLFRNGKCQHAQKLIFDQTFTFEMKKNLGNLMATNFKGVDIFGDFGNRGMIDVDIQYVSLRSVEFLTGTQNGRVTAYVSKEEFAKNKHNALLELVTKFVPDRSVQPLDW